MAIETTSFQRQFVVSSDTEPSSKFEGLLWKDTANDVLKSYDASSDSWETVGNSIDGDTIIKNENGEIAVGYPHKINLLDLENSQGDWTISRTQDNADGTGTVNFNSGYVGLDVISEVDEYGKVEAGIEATKDLSDIDEITINILYTTTEKQKCDGFVYINGTQEIASDISTISEWRVDTSSYGENATIEIFIEVGGYIETLRGGTLRVDNIESKEKSLPLTTIYRGAGE